MARPSQRSKVTPHLNSGVHHNMTATANATTDKGRVHSKNRRAMRPCSPAADQAPNNFTTAPSKPPRMSVAPTVMANTKSSARPNAASPNRRATNNENKKPPKAPSTLMSKTVPEPLNKRRQEPSRCGEVSEEFVNLASFGGHFGSMPWQPRQESNLDRTFRKRLFYPLNYGAVWQRNIAHCEAAEKSPASGWERGRSLLGGKAPWAVWAILGSNQ